MWRLHQVGVLIGIIHLLLQGEVEFKVIVGISAQQ